MMTAASVQTDDLAGTRALVSGGTRGTGAAVAARLKDAGAHVTATGRHAVEHLHADEFLVADVTTVEGTDTVIGHVSANGGADIIVHVAGGGASAPSGGSRRSPQSYGTTPCSSTSSEQYDSIAA